jgi:hypothetical protein
MAALVMEFPLPDETEPAPVLRAVSCAARSTRSARRRRCAPALASAVEITEATLAHIAARNPALNAFTAVTAERALAEARAIDRRRARGETLGPLAGAPFAVKNLFDIEGSSPSPGRRSTPSGRRPRRRLHPAQIDRGRRDPCRRAQHGRIRLRLHDREHALRRGAQPARPGACRRRIVGRLGRGGRRRPRADRARLRHQRLDPRAVVVLRHVRAEADLWAAKPGRNAPVCREPRSSGAARPHGRRPRRRPTTRCRAPIRTTRPAPVARSSRLRRASNGARGLRIAIAGGHFAGSGVAAEAVATVAQGLGATRVVEVPEAARARAAAFVITASEGADLHLADLKSRAQDFDPMTRDRFWPARLVPAGWVLRAQRFRRWYREQVLALFREVDILLAPATPCPAPRIGQETIEIDGVTVPSRPFIGVYTQPLSFIGLPIVAAPLRRPGELPIGCADHRRAVARGRRAARRAGAGTRRRHQCGAGAWLMDPRSTPGCRRRGNRGVHALRGGAQRQRRRRAQRVVPRRALYAALRDRRGALRP